MLSQPGSRGADPAIFIRDMMRFTPRAWVTPTLVAANVALFALQIAMGVSLTSPTSDALLGWGANLDVLTMNGEWWRLLTCCFLHIGVMHLGFNMLALWRSGVFVEQLYGNVAFLCLYLVAGVGGSVSSLLFHHLTVSAGASGAIFGVFGGLVGFLARNRNTMPKGMLRALRSNVVQMLVLNGLISVAIPQIDLAAHGGGFVVGVLFGFAVAQPMTREGASKRVSRALIAVGVAVAALVAWVFALAPHPAPLPEDAYTIRQPSNVEIDSRVTAIEHAPFRPRQNA